MLYNLLANALAYSPDSASVTVTACEDSAFVRVEIVNTGVTLPPEQLNRVFERFYRGDAARTQGESLTRGAGLGLAIAKGFIEAMGGTIGVTSGGDATCFTFTLPRADAAR